ncbi:MAG TPA: hypothetical protein VJY83_03315 [Thiopseudomonas sp.]|nr:hypothetical protein [Pseudomonas sp.]HKM36651.1 hypothetical protein [Thiopseudomonas sp.]
MFKLSRIAALLCITATVSMAAQANDHAQMMQKMMQMQSCIEQNVDTTYFDNLGKDAQARSEEIKQMCLAGKRDQAQKAAIVYATAIHNDPNFQALKKCIVDLGSDFPGVKDMQEGFDLESLDKQHVCDNLD